MSNFRQLQLRVRQDDLARQNSVISGQIKAGVPVEKIIDVNKLPRGVEPYDVLISSKLAEKYRMSMGEAFGSMPFILNGAYGEKYSKQKVFDDLYNQKEPFDIKAKYNSEAINKQIELEKKELGTKTKVMDALSEILDQDLANEAAVYSKHLSQNYNVLDPQTAKTQFFTAYMGATDERGRKRAETERYLYLMGQRQKQVDAFDNWQANQKKRVLDPDNGFVRKVKSFRRGGTATDVALFDVGAILTGIAGKIPGLARYEEISKEFSNLAHAFSKTLDMPFQNVDSTGAFDSMTNSLFENVPYISLATVSSLATGGSTGGIFLSSAAYEGSSIYHDCLKNGMNESSAKTRGWIGGVINGAFESVGGGAKKYMPKTFKKKLIGYGKSLTNNALKEIFAEELPQEVVSTLLTGNVPYDDNGDINWKEVTNRIVLLARDTAFMSLVLTSTGSLAESGSRFQMKKNYAKDAEAIQNAWNILKETAQQEAAIPLSEASPAAPEQKVGQAPTVVPPKAKVDNITVETPILDTDMSELVDSSPSYGILQAEDGKYVVLDWDTQQEIKTGLSKAEALSYTKDLNNGTIDPPQITKKVLQKDTDVIALTYTQLINNVLGTSKTKRQAASNAAKVILTMHKDLAAYAKIELDKIDITQSQRDRLLKKIASAKNDKDRMEAAVLVEAMAEQQQQLSGIKEFKKLRKFVNRAAKLKMRDGGIPAGVYKNLQSILDNYTTLSAKVLNSIKRSKAYLEGIRQSTNDKFSAEYAEAIMPKSLVDKMGQLDASNLKDKTADEIREINNTIKQFLHQAQLYSRLMDGRQKRTAKAYLDYAIANVKFAKKYDLTDAIPNRGLFKGLYDTFVGISNHDIYTIANNIWGLDNPVSMDIIKMRRLQSTIWLELQSMVRTASAHIDDDMLRKWSHEYSVLESRTAHNIEQKMGRGITEYNFKIGDNTIQFSMAELCSLYMGLQDKYWRNRFINNGGALVNWVGGEKRYLGKLDKEVISEMVETVNSNPQAKKFCENLVVLKNRTQEILNTTSRKLDGFDIAQVDNQWHVEYVSEGGVVGTEYTRDSIQDENGRLKPRTTSSRPVVIRDIFQVLGEDARVVSNFAGKAEAFRKLRLLANNPAFREKMIVAGKRHILKEFDSRIRAIQVDAKPPTLQAVRAAMAISSNVRKSILTGIQIVGVQPMSAALYATECDFKYMSALRIKVSQEQNQDLLDNWVLYKVRNEGIASASSIVSHGTIKKMFTGKGTSTDYILAPLHKGDIMGIRNGGLIALAEMSDKNLDGISLDWWQRYGVNPLNLKYGTKEFWEAFNDRADWLVTHTQPMFNPENRSLFTNSDNPLVREFFRFRGFVDQLLRIPSRQMSLMEYGQISKIRGSVNIANAAILSGILKVVTQTILGALLGKEKEADQFLADLISAPLSLMPIIGYPSQKIAHKILGVKNTRMPTFSTAGMMMAENVMRHSWQVATGLSYLFGDDQYVKGKKQSTEFIKKGVVGGINDGLVILGIPTRAVTQIEWFKEKKTK